MSKKPMPYETFRANAARNRLPDVTVDEWRRHVEQHPDLRFSSWLARIKDERAGGRKIVDQGVLLGYALGGRDFLWNLKCPVCKGADGGCAACENHPKGKSKEKVDITSSFQQFLTFYDNATGELTQLAAKGHLIGLVHGKKVEIQYNLEEGSSTDEEGNPYQTRMINGVTMDQREKHPFDPVSRLQPKFLTGLDSRAKNAGGDLFSLVAIRGRIKTVYELARSFENGQVTEKWPTNYNDKNCVDVIVWDPDYEINCHCELRPTNLADHIVDITDWEVSDDPQAYRSNHRDKEVVAVGYLKSWNESKNTFKMETTAIWEIEPTVEENPIPVPEKSAPALKVPPQVATAKTSVERIVGCVHRAMQNAAIRDRMDPTILRTQFPEIATFDDSILQTAIDGVKSGKFPPPSQAKINGTKKEEDPLDQMVSAMKDNADPNGEINVFQLCEILNATPAAVKQGLTMLSEDGRAYSPSEGKWKVSPEE